MCALVCLCVCENNDHSDSEHIDINVFTITVIIVLGLITTCRMLVLFSDIRCASICILAAVRTVAGLIHYNP